MRVPVLGLVDDLAGSRRFRKGFKHGDLGGQNFDIHLQEQSTQFRRFFGGIWGNPGEQYS